MYLLRLALAFLCLMTYGSAWAETSVVWVVSPDTGPAYRETLDALRGAVDKTNTVTWVNSTPDALQIPATQPRLVIAVGSGALAKLVDYFNSPARTAAGALPTPPIVATLLPRRAYEREMARATGRLRATAVVLDQPPARQTALIGAAFPRVKTVGFLTASDSLADVKSLSAAMAEHGYVVRTEDVSTRGLPAALQGLLDDSDIVFGIPDPAIYNAETITSILTAGYRRRVPLVAFSPAYVKAGALLGLYSSPAQVGRATARLMREVLAGAPLPVPAAPNEFSIDVNAAVARSMGFALDESDIRSRMGEGGRQ